MEPVTNVLIERRQMVDGLSPMVVVSAIVHGALVAGLILAPAAWKIGQRHDEPKSVMTISLGGAAGPRVGGMNPLGGRAIQEAVPAPDARRPEPVRPPAAKEPEMTIPKPGTQPRPAPKVTQAPEDSKGQTASRGPQAQFGTAIAETGGQGAGWGLSTGGGGTGSYLDVGNFCCPEYLSTMLNLIQRNWNARQQAMGDVVVKYTVQRNGLITGVAVEQSSGVLALDVAAERALVMTRQLPPLPAAFDQDHLTVHLAFQYAR